MDFNLIFISGGPIAYAQSPNYTAFHLEDETAQFQAIFCANPPPSKVFWIAGGHVLHPGTTHHTMTAHNIVVKFFIHLQNKISSEGFKNILFYFLRIRQKIVTKQLLLLAMSSYLMLENTPWL